MKSFPRIAAAALAATLLLGGSAAGALATDEPSGPAVEQSNVSLSDSDITDLVVLKPGGAPSSDRMGPPPANTGNWPVFHPITNKTTGEITPYEATKAVTGPDGSTKWRAIYLEDVRPGYAKNSSSPGWFWIEDAYVLSSQPKAAVEAAVEASRAASNAAALKFAANFTGTGTVTGNSYAEADSTTEPVAFASFPGNSSRLSEAFEAPDGQQWHKLPYNNEMRYVLASGVEGFKSDADVATSSTSTPTPSAPSTPTPSNSPAAAAPLIPEGMPGNAAPTGDASNAVVSGPDSAVAAADEPGNLGVMLAVGGVIVVGAGAYLYVQTKKKPKGVSVKEEPTEEEPTD